MKRRILAITALLLVACMLLASCGGEATLEKLTITGGLKQTYELNEVTDFSKITATATYSDGTTKSLTAADLQIGTIDTTTAGTKKLTITYGEISIDVDIVVKPAPATPGNPGGETPENPGGETPGGEETPAFTHEITGVQKPDSLVASLGANRNRFNVKTGNYVVGDDNPFTFRLKVTAFDENDEQVTLTSYVSVSTVYLVEGSTKTPAGTNYVVVDETKQTFDFTDAAVGKTFEIVTRPRDIYEEDYQDFTHSLVVDVVNGYNVTDAKELNLMTNAPTEMHEMFADKDTVRQNALAAAFVDAHYGAGYYNQYGGDLLKGLVLHCDLSPAPADLPADYIVTVGGKTGFDDSFTVYDRILKGAGDTFNIYGNFFTVNTKFLPLMSNAPDIVGNQVSSDSDVFGLEDDGSMAATLEQRQNYDYTIYTSKVSNLAMRGFDGTSNDASASGAHMRGLNGWDVLNIDMTMDNVVMEAYTISIVLSNCNMRLNILNSRFDNAWQNHIFVWAHNGLQNLDEYHDSEPWANLKRIEVNVRNTTMTKCGGPVIMCISDNDETYNKTAGVDVTVDAASHLESMVAGTEAWFEAYNGAPFFALTQAQQIKAMSGPIANSASNQGKTASFITTLPDSGDAQFMNMVVAILTGEGSYKLVDADGNVIKTLMDSTSQTVVDYENGALSAAPLFQSVEDPNATAYYLQGQMDTDPSIVYAPNPNAELNNPSTWVTPNIPSALFEGDHIGMYYNGMALLLGYFH